MPVTTHTVGMMAMRYQNTLEAKFIERRNRFAAEVELNGKCETVHVKNTGRCKELLQPGARVVLQKVENPARKTRYDLISVYKQGLGWVNIDSQAPNHVVREWLESGTSEFSNLTLLKPEYQYGTSRVDFYLECEERKILLEVKGCTLEIDGKGYFPDAPTKRGIKHLDELAKASIEGYESYIAFVIAMPGVETVYPNTCTHPEFAVALEGAVRAGVKVLHLPCQVLPDELVIVK